MRILGPAAATAMILAGCEGREEGPKSPPAKTLSPESPRAGGSVAPSSAPSPSPTDVPNRPAARWDLQSNGEGVALALMPASGRATIRLFCPPGENRLLVNVPTFRPIASEERLSFGGGGEAAVLVADPRGDRERGGVSGAGEVPDDLAGLVGGPLSASYGAQGSGPHPAPPRELTRAFVAACREGTSMVRPPDAAPLASTNPCLMQDGRPLRTAPLRAVGTEPFWGARIEGRCVTFSHLEDQDGTRVWTRFTPGSGGGGAWSGTLGGRRFELRTRALPRCSDGMSDKRYPLAVDLAVGGEQRSGCAEPS